MSGAVAVVNEISESLAVLCWCHSLSCHLFLLRHSAGLCDCSVQTLGLGKEGLVCAGFVFSVGIGTLDLCYTYLNLPSYKESLEIDRCI